MNLLKRSQENLIAEETAKLFCASSINNVTIKDIANHLGIGEATIYRHYGNKYNLVLSVANYLQSKVYKDYFSFDKLTSGYEQISNFYKSYLNIYKENPNYYRFINEFDAYVILNVPEDISEYEQGINVFKSIYLNAYEKGIQDGSINKIDDIDTFYFSTTHALLGLCKKLSDKDVLPQDTTLDKAREIEVLIETILYRLK